VHIVSADYRRSQLEGKASGQQIIGASDREGFFGKT
jgi:hypothetical protein